MKRLSLLLTLFLTIPLVLTSQNKEEEVDNLIEKVKEYIYTDLDSAYYFAKQALKDSKKIHYLKGEMDAEFQIGRVYVDQARRVLALESGTLSLKIAEELDNYEGIKNALNLISKIHNHANDINEGIKDMRKLLNLAIIEDDSTQIALSYNFLGIFKNKVNEPDSSYYFTNQSMIINRKLKNEKSLAYNYNSLGIYHYGKGNLDTSFSYFRKSLKIRTQLKLQNQSIEAYNNLGYVFLREGIADSAIIYFKKSVEACHEYNKKNNLAVVYENLSKSYEIKGNHEEALNAIRKSIPIRDSLLGLKQHEQIVKREHDKNEAGLLREKELKYQTKKDFIIIIVLLSILFFAIAVTFISRKRRLETERETKKRKEEQTRREAAQEIIFAQEKTRNTIAKELHDGVGGTLAVLKLNLHILQEKKNYPELKKEIEILETVSQEVRSLSHNITPIFLKKQNFTDILSDYIERNRNDIEIFCFTTPKEEVNEQNIDLLINLYRIIQEVFSNIIKHSQATKVNIQIMGNKDHLSLFIEDNGIGFDNNNNNNGIGINNIKQRAKLFKGDMIIDTEVNKGTNITVTLKY